MCRKELKPHILFVTSSNLAINPRCVKEIELALELGYKTSILKFSFSNWSSVLDDSITASLSSAVFYNIKAGKTPFFLWLLSFMTSRLAAIISLFCPGSIKWLSYSLDRRSWLINRYLKTISLKPDLIVAHNPAAFWPVASFAVKNTIPYAIDVEDYHPGEYSNNQHADRMLEIMKTTLPKANYVSFASTLILEQSLFDIRNFSQPIVVNNCFPSGEFISPASLKNSKLRLVWYSQHIDFGRGLEKILPLLIKVGNLVEVTLIGKVKQGFETFLKSYSFVQVVPPLPQQELHVILATFDIGLALEEKTANLNRELCLTNKIWSYFQAGLYILATDTSAQERFITEHKNSGVLINHDNYQGIYNTIQNLIGQKDKIRHKALSRQSQARLFSWEKEKMKLTDAWTKVFYHSGNQMAAW